MLGASLFSWAHGLHAAADRSTWVRIDPTPASGAATAELWHVSARCIRPYFVRSVLRSKAKLAAHYNAAPDEVRARLNVGTSPGHSVEPAAWHPAGSGSEKESGRRDPYGEYVAALQVKYAEWYAALFKLEIAAGNWQQRLLHAADQTVIVSAASRASFAAYSRGDLKLAGTQGDFDGQFLTALGLGGFSEDEQASLKSACVTITPVAESLRDPSTLGAIWRWPLDCLAEFSFGLELLLTGLFFVPIAAWLGTGDLGLKPHAASLRSRLHASVRDLGIGNLGMSEFVERVGERVRDIYAAGLCFALSGARRVAKRQR